MNTIVKKTQKILYQRYNIALHERYILMGLIAIPLLLILVVVTLIAPDVSHTTTDLNPEPIIAP